MKRINLLPQEERVKASRERGLIWAILILVAVVVVLGLVYVKYNSDVSAKQDELAGIQAETAVVQAQIAELSPYAALQAQRTAMTETAKGIYESSRPVLDPAAGAQPRHPGERAPADADGDRAADHAAGRRGRRGGAGRCRDGRRHLHRADREAPGRGRVHDAARPHPAAHGHHADHARPTRAPRRHDHGELRAHRDLQAVHRHGAAAAVHDAPPTTTLQGVAP